MRSVLTIGTFDGVHLGHRKISEKVVQLAKKTKTVPAAITFDIPPRLFFFPSAEPCLLTSVTEKMLLLKKYGIKKAAVLKFNRKLSRISADDFFKNFVVRKCGARAIVVGANFAFGRNRQGDARFLEKCARKHSIPVIVVPPLCSGNVPVSSGRIREVLRAGRVEESRRLLGYPYSISGKVVRGLDLGKKIGFPTANLAVPPQKILPPGVFAVRASISGESSKPRTFGGMCNIGFKPTVLRGNRKMTAEVHLFRFAGGLYGKTLKVEFFRKLREEKVFQNLAELRDQLERDKVRALEALKKDNR